MRRKYMSTNKYRKAEREHKKIINTLDEKRNKRVNFQANPNSIVNHKEMYKQCEWVYNNIKDKDRLVRCPYFTRFSSDDLLNLSISLIKIAVKLEELEEKYQYPVFIDSNGSFFNLNLFNLWIEDITNELQRRGDK